MALLDVVDATLLRGRSPSPPLWERVRRAVAGVAVVGVAARGGPNPAVGSGGRGRGGQRRGVPNEHVDSCAVVRSFEPW